MKNIIALTITVFACLPANSMAAESGKPLRPVHTYSIVARDAETGELGAAVQSHWFSVGSNVIWAEPGIGAVATQSFIEPSYGPLGLQLMRAGKTAEQALTALLAADEHADVRQVGMVDANGTVANHTGDNAIIEFCNLTGDSFAVQANLMWKPTVCSATREILPSVCWLHWRLRKARAAIFAANNRWLCWWSVATSRNRHGAAESLICVSKTMRNRCRKCAGC